MSNVSWHAHKIISEKVKQFRKTQSQEALEEQIFEYYKLLPSIAQEFEMNIFESAFSSVGTALTFDVNFNEIPTYYLSFKTKLPSPEQYALGKLINVEKMYALENYPEYAPWFRDVYTFVYTHINPAWAWERLEKARYGISRYGESYYDPNKVRDFIRATALEVTKKARSIQSAAIIFRTLAETLHINPDVADYYFAQLMAWFFAKYHCAMWEYAWWDVTEWCEEKCEGEPEGVLRTVNLELGEETIYVEHYADIWGGSSWDFARWDLSYWALDKLPTVEDVPHESKYALVGLADALAREARSRLLYTPLFLANYQTAHERSSPFASRRTHMFGYARTIYYTVKNIVDNMLRNVPSFIRSMYVAAVMSLIGRLTAIHRWGTEAYRDLRVDELKEQWVNEWSSKGLDRNVLSQLFDRVRPLIEAVRDVRVREKKMLMSRYGE